MKMGGKGGFGPSFLPASSKLYRLEYAAATIAVLVLLIYRSLYLGGLDWASTIFWIIFPDLVAFIPIGISSKRKEWPAWGGYLYDTFHTTLTWGLAFGVSWVVLGGPYWPILGWLGHIVADRAMGFGLRST